MIRFAILETSTGFVWGVTDAADAIEACRIVDLYFNEHDCEYTEGSVADLRTGAYDVRIAPAGFDVDDGQDADSIAAVDALPRAAVILSRYSDR